MRAEPIQALQAGARDSPLTPRKPRLLVAGATGVLGNEVLRRLVGLQHYSVAQVLAREPITTGLRGVGATLVPGDDPSRWPAGCADTGLVMFEPPRLFYDRERALWTPAPEQLPEVARWMQRSGVRTLAIVLPHEQARLPEALKRGLASLDEQAVAALGFERLLIVRAAQKPRQQKAPSWPAAVARWMLSVTGYMVPSREQPVRSPRLAEFVGVALQLAPPGIHVASSDLVWTAAQGDIGQAVRQWLARDSG